MRFDPGDRVGVTDPGLRQLRVIMEQATGLPAEPNHHGTVDRAEDGLVYVNFDKDGVEGAGGQAPYPDTDVYLLSSQPAWEGGEEKLTDD